MQLSNLQRQLKAFDKATPTRLYQLDFCPNCGGEHRDTYTGNDMILCAISKLAQELQDKEK